MGSGSQRVSFQLQQAGGEGGRAAGSELTYGSVRPGVDVSYTPTTVGVRETLTLASASAPASYAYKLSYAVGVHAALNAQGGVDFTDSTAHVLFQIAPPLVSDSSPGAHLPAAGQAHYELSNDGSTLTLVISTSWLQEPSRVFPVRVDPDVVYSEQTDCAIVSSKYENSNLCNGALFVGPNSETPKAVGRSLLQFNLSSIPRNHLILRSRLELWFKADTTTSPLEIEAYGLTRSFTQKATWNKYDGEHSWTTPGGDYSATLAGKQKLLDSEKGHWISWGFTPLVQQWVHEPSSNYGVLLKASNETTAGYDEFYQANNSGKTDEPSLEVEYTCYTGVNEGDVLFGPELAGGGELAVQAANGNLLVTTPDINVEGEGYETRLARYYNSRDENTTGYSFGKSWLLGTGNNTLLYPSSWDHSYAFHEEGGGWTRFDPTPPLTSSESASSAKYVATPGLNASLVVHENGTRTLTFNETGTEWLFDNSGNGFPQQIVEHEGAGNTISLSYIESKLSKVKDTHGHEWTMTRESGTGNVTKIEAPATKEHWEYGYNASHQLTSYKTPAGAETKYSYGTNGLLAEVIDGSGTYVISYDTHSPPRVTSIRKVINGTSKEVGTEDEITSYEYKTPESPACKPPTDVSETVISYKPTGEPETFCFDGSDHFTGPMSEAEQTQQETAEPGPEVAAGTCEEDKELGKGDCALEEPAPEPEEDLQHANYGLADSNWLFATTQAQQEHGVEHSFFDYLANPSIEALKVTKYRRSVPWNMVFQAELNQQHPGEDWGAQARLEDVEEWVKLVKAKGAEPYVSFDIECGFQKGTSQPTTWDDPRFGLTEQQEREDDHSCTRAPTKAQYKAAVERFMKHGDLSEVRYFIALNEPNMEGKVASKPTNGEKVAEVYKKPTYSATKEVGFEELVTGAFRAGEYWRALDALCAKTVREAEKKPECYVAAGEFLDSNMENAYKGAAANVHTGYTYFRQYIKGLGSQPKAYRWAWHAYSDGAEAGENAHLNREPKKWWSRFLNFQKAVNAFMAHGKYTDPKIWLSEQGVQFFLREEIKPPWRNKATAKAVMNAYVKHGSGQLTERSHQISRFFYYNSQGSPGFDTGLLEASTLPKGAENVSGRKNGERPAPGEPREIYRIYKQKTPG